MTYARETLLGLLIAIAAAIILLLPGGLTPEQGWLMGLVLVTLGLWATALLPPFLTALLFFTALLVGGLAPPELVFSGFTSPAMWLVISGFAIGAAIGGSGLGARLGTLAAPFLSRSYPMLIGGLVVLGDLLGFLMPAAAGRAMVLIPIAMALSEAVGLRPGSPGRTGVAVATALASTMPSFAILPANLPNMVLSGAADSILGLHLGYADYLLLHYPVLGLVKSVAIVLLVLRLFPASPRPAGAVPEEAGAAQRGGRQLWLAVILLVTLGFWTTDGWHGVNPAWVGMAAAIVLLLPRIGFVTGPGFKAAVDFPTLLLIAGVLALGQVVSAAGLGDVLARAVTGLLPLAPGRDFVNFASLSLLAVLTALVTTVPGVPAVLTPLAPQLAAATGLPLETVLMTQVIGFSTVVFPYQSPPILIAMSLAGEPVKAAMKATLALTVVTLGVLVPLDFLWWRLLGWI